MGTSEERVFRERKNLADTLSPKAGVAGYFENCVEIRVAGKV